MTQQIAFVPVEPIGHRTCCDVQAKTHSVQHEWLDHAVPEYVMEESELQMGLLDPIPTMQQHLDALGQFDSLKRRAANGQLRVGTVSPTPAKVMKRVPYVIELIPLLTGRGPRPRLFRLYYAEPASVQGALLPLVLSTKPNSDDPDGEQDKSIDEAGHRSTTWETANSSKGKQ